MIAIEEVNAEMMLKALVGHVGGRLFRGEPSETRNGPAYVAPVTMALTTRRPWECVVFDETRDANPFFHLVEAAWMLVGRHDVAPLAAVLPSIARYSDDGRTFHGAYGYRWRWHFAIDQIERTVGCLSADPGDRRGGVIAMWDARADPRAADDEGGVDVPCNVMAIASVRGTRLDLTVFNRSNDLVWGALGANAVQFGFLARYLADRLQLAVGDLVQVTTNLHAYDNEQFRRLRARGTDLAERPWPNRYMPRLPGSSAPPTVHSWRDWMVAPGGESAWTDAVHEVLDKVITEGHIGWFERAEDSTPTWVRRVLLPMAEAFAIRRDTGDNDRAAGRLNAVPPRDMNLDWLTAGREWLKRRAKKGTTA